MPTSRTSTAISARVRAIQAPNSRGVPPPAQKVCPADATPATRPPKGTGRPARCPVPSAPSVEAAKLIATLPRRVCRPFPWRRGTKGPLKARFAAVRVRVADGPVAAHAQHLPGDEAWLVCEQRAGRARKYHLTNHPADAPLRALAATIKARWTCEQMHQQMKRELGLDHFEGRRWRGLHHHALLCQIAFAFLQHLRLGGNPPVARHRGTGSGPPPAPSLSQVGRRLLATLLAHLLRRPRCGHRLPRHPLL
jgi:SRSO17 transposase